MKLMKLFVLTVLLCSTYNYLFLSSIQAIAETTTEKNAVVIDQPELTVTYKTEEVGANIFWQLTWEKQGSEKKVQRLKFKALDEQDQSISYPQVKELEERAGWLVEKSFTARSTGQVTLTTPKDQKKLVVSIQMDTLTKGVVGEETIRENTLSVKDSYNLKFLSPTTNEESQEQTVSQETVVLPKSSPLLFQPMGSVKQEYPELYNNKEPQYTNSTSLGTYPTHSWQPDGQTTVINHQGGFEGSEGWDGVKSWDASSDDRTKSYIHYGDDLNNPNISLRKYITETETPNEFKVKLNVRGETTYKPGLDIVFLIDNSASMDVYQDELKDTRKDAAEKVFANIIKELKTIHQPSADNIRIGGEIFSSFRGNEWGFGSSGGKYKFPISSNPADWDKFVSEHKRAYEMGTTFTQRGLQESKDLFDAAPNSAGRKRVLFLLTDGAPNESWKPTVYSENDEMYYDKYRLGGFNMGTKPNYLTGNNLMGSPEVVGNTTKIEPPYGGKVNSHMTTTNSTAWDLKNAGIEIHTVALTISVHLREKHTKEELLKGLYKLATKKADASNNANGESENDYFYHNVKDISDLTGTFKDWFETIARTVDKGKITDPLGDMVELVPNKTPKITSVGNSSTPIASAAMATLDISDPRQVKVNNINLTGGQEIEVEYTVRLKTEDASFKPDYWYPANGQTILEPTPQKSTDKLDFGVPSVKAREQTFTIPVKKQWADRFEGSDNYFQLRPATIKAILQKQSGDSWTDVAEVELTAKNQWQAEFVEVAPGQTYRVIEQIATQKKVTGYHPPSYNQESFTAETLSSEGILITNKLLTTNYSFVKLKSEDQAPFNGNDKPRFTIIHKESNQVFEKNIEPDANGRVALTGLAIGTYKVEETHVPSGYQKMTDFEIKVTEDINENRVIAMVDGSTAEKVVENKKIADFTLILHKVADDLLPLTGAEFQLMGTDYNQTLSDGSDFIFKNLREGSYKLIETKTPKGYQGMDEPLMIEIIGRGEDYLVNMEAKPYIVEYDSVVTNNTIEVTLKNEREQKPSILPSTGSMGRGKIFQVAAFFFLTGIVTTIVYGYINRKRLP
ncbi:SpaA isopeptide-forming pilin-related protein [Enterococcus devriesei]|uniref:SpaA isopeptide-forming pilin-related protein n=1 Tax=Enterococcus devriesei TaxID=319970 RepID=UPI0009003E66|nr:SpaA isopeptide-forming pilin-related protein [Enterococcus devriesei]